MRGMTDSKVHESSTTDPIWHAQPADTVLAQLEVDRHRGLDTTAAQARLAQYGPNSLPSPPRRAAWLRLLLQFHNPLIYVLLASAAATLALDDYVDAAVIAMVVMINAMIGFMQEGKAERALDAVRGMLARRARVLRDGERHEIDAADLVPGDVVLLESGDKVPADLRLFRSRNLRTMEAVLTGESLPVEKSEEPVATAADIGDRVSMVYSGTLVAFGQAQGVVVATGASTEIGRIGTLVGDIPSLVTPLTRRLDQFSLQVTLFILAVGLMTFLFGYLVRGMPPLEIFLAVVGLAVAAIPEGLPAVVTIVLAIGTRILASNRAIVRRLPAVETLGSVSMICSDKTGTLTRNEMSVVHLQLAGQSLRVTGTGYEPEGGFHDESDGDSASIDPLATPAIDALARCALLCNDAHLRQADSGEWALVGDPTEGALLALAHKAGLDGTAEAQRYPRLDEIPFESEQRFMATLHHDHTGHHIVLLKGAPEQVLALCDSEAEGEPLDTAFWHAAMDKAASRGERVLALAQCSVPGDKTAIELADITRRFRLLGMVGIMDPPREEAIKAVMECQAAGICVKMITGDHAVTAAAIGRRLGLMADRALTGAEIETLDDKALQQRALETDVIARASPEHKLRLVAALKAMGHQVAMTGDGVNDAPALKAADIGVAMGHKGTDAARESSDLVLTDDNFATIARAVREGRVVFDNIKKALLFMLPTSGGEAGVILLAVFAGLALPVTAGQILWVNTVTAVTLALALAFEPAEQGVMLRPPRPPTEPLITRALGLRILFVSLLMVAATFAVFEWELARGSNLEFARTAAVNMLVFGELIYLFQARHFTASGLSIETLTGNRVAVWVSLALVALQALFTYSAPLQQVFKTQSLDGLSWGLILGLGAVMYLAIELEKWLWRRTGRIHF
jgi:magnesium-transporting ATPase (P-type)